MATLQGLIKNARRVLSDPAMLWAYTRWCASRVLRLEGPVVRLTNGSRLFIWHDFSDFWWGRQLAILDASEANLMRRIVTEAAGRPTVAIDVGAHVGVFSLNMCGAGFSLIHAFEANPRTFSRLARHCYANRAKGVQLTCAAVGEDYGIATFVIGYGSGIDHVDPTGASAQGSTIRVMTVALDAYCEKAGIERVDLLKVDVEGYESWVIRGASTMLRERRIATVILEICPALLERAGTSAAIIHDLFNGLGYDVREIESDGKPGRLLSIADLEAVRKLELPFINVLCVPR